jgi:group I intron endonuclease
MKDKLPGSSFGKPSKTFKPRIHAPQPPAIKGSSFDSYTKDKSTRKIKSGIMGIYSIECIETKSVYVGQSKDLRSRWNQHKTLLRTGKAINSDFQRDYDAYGIDGFKFNILHYCDEHELLEWETFFIRDYLRLNYNVYNHVIDTCSTSIVNCPKYYTETIRRIIKHLERGNITTYQIDYMLDNL